ncbi:MAG: acyltransferase [Oscillospiraceae bacterium]|nr:acyltransferase [Oscillospiraceae bacterium]
MDTQITRLQRYNNLDALRTIAAIGVICMHVRANIGFDVAVWGGTADYVVNTLIAQMGGFVQLFFILSGFSMCCGYYERIKNNEISLNKFYSRRYERILPFFALLVLIDLVVSLVFDGGISAGSIAEAFANLTLMFGFYTTSGMSVIGVGWTLGIIFGFYILFPFFVYLIWNKKRAWFSFAITCVIYVLCCEYFDSGSSLMFRWMCYFVLGGLMYLYKDSIVRFFERKTWLGVVFVLVGFAVVYMIPFSGEGTTETIVGLIKNIIGYGMMIIGALCPDTKLLSNPVSKFVSGVSFEIYLAHMMVFRVIDKLGLATIAGETLVSYILVCIGTTGGALVFAKAYQCVEGIVKKRYEESFTLQT